MPLKLPATHKALLNSLTDTGLTRSVVEHLATQARHALVFEIHPCDDASIFIGSSKIGGLPDLPPHMPWPHRAPYADAQTRAQWHSGEAQRLLKEAAIPAHG